MSIADEDFQTNNSSKKEPHTYEILEHESRYDMEAAVTRMMANGWVPTGGVHVRKGPEWSHVYSQAMVKGL